MKNKMTSAFTLVEIMIVVAIIALLASIAVPSLLNAMNKSRSTGCAANLKQIEGAKIRWALEQKKASTETPSDSDLFGPASYIADKPVCPAGGAYNLNSLETKPTCSILGHTY